MNTDSTTRLLLLGILVCLIALVAQGFGGTSEAGRYTLTGMRAGSPVLIRTDTATGEVWKLELRGGGGTWQLFAEPGEGEDGEEEALAAQPPSPLTGSDPIPRDADLEASAALSGLDEPERRRGPKIKFAKPTPKRAPAAPAPGRSPTEEAEADFESFLDAVVREDLPPEIRIWSVAQLGRSDDPRSTDALIRALDTPDPKIRAAVIEALGTRDDPRVAEALSARQ